jgi:hypothetical protein
MPDVADRQVDAQLTAPCVGASGVEHAGTKHSGLELANATLPAEKKPSIRSAEI